MSKTIQAQKPNLRDKANPNYRPAHESLDAEFSLIQSLIGGRKRVALEQAELAQKMGRTESVISRLGCGREKPRHGHSNDTPKRRAILSELGLSLLRRFAVEVR
jgi:ribosome-binding protein aMBF1 (putative translation factor)